MQLLYLKRWNNIIISPLSTIGLSAFNDLFQLCKQQDFTKHRYSVQCIYADISLPAPKPHELLFRFLPF